MHSQRGVDGLGLATRGVVADQHEGDETNAAGAIVMFKLADGLILSLYPRSSPRTRISPRAHLFTLPAGAVGAGENGASRAWRPNRRFFTWRLVGRCEILRSWSPGTRTRACAANGAHALAARRSRSDQIVSAFP